MFDPPPHSSRVKKPPPPTIPEATLLAPPLRHFSRVKKPPPPTIPETTLLAKSQSTSSVPVSTISDSLKSPPSFAPLLRLPPPPPCQPPPIPIKSFWEDVSDGNLATVFYDDKMKLQLTTNDAGKKSKNPLPPQATQAVANHLSKKYNLAASEYIDEIPPPIRIMMISGARREDLRAYEALYRLNPFMVETSPQVLERMLSQLEEKQESDCTLLAENEFKRGQIKSTVFTPPYPWQEHWTEHEQGPYPYYFNTITGESVWELPASDDFAESLPSLIDSSAIKDHSGNNNDADDEGEEDLEVLRRKVREAANRSSSASPRPVSTLPLIGKGAEPAASLSLSLEQRKEYKRALYSGL
jgi:hypothetical protein